MTHTHTCGCVGLTLHCFRAIQQQDWRIGAGLCLLSGRSKCCHCLPWCAQGVLETSSILTHHFTALSAFRSAQLQWSRQVDVLYSTPAANGSHKAMLQQLEIHGAGLWKQVVQLEVRFVVACGLCHLPVCSTAGCPNFKVLWLSTFSCLSVPNPIVKSLYVICCESCCVATCVLEELNCL